MEINLKLYGSSKILSDKDTLKIQLPNNSNIQKVRNILTSGPGIRVDDLFMIWTALQIENNQTNLIVYQHGGGYGVSKHFFNQFHELEISEHFINWGWNSNNAKISQLGFLKYPIDSL